MHYFVKSISSTAEDPRHPRLSHVTLVPLRSGVNDPGAWHVSGVSGKGPGKMHIVWSWLSLCTSINVVANTNDVVFPLFTLPPIWKWTVIHTSSFQLWSRSLPPRYSARSRTSAFFEACETCHFSPTSYVDLPKDLSSTAPQQSTMGRCFRGFAQFVPRWFSYFWWPTPLQ